MNQQTPSSSLSNAATAVANPDSVPVLHFKFHSFQSFCFDTYGCTVVYAGLRDTDDSPSEKSRSFESVGGEALLKTMGGSGHINIKNFPASAKVTWRSKDGTYHSAEIDIGKIFKDERIIHHMPLRDFPFPNNPMGSADDPTILLVVDDRTIKVYMLSIINVTKYLTLAYSQTF
ncbi:hypothetical protein [Brachymonas sp. M4Q-1]|uniref:hypothetical protein n=1 Tax=Brachymonas sp. M4Q-1 TaxID=3416906 RepID=UPI003CEFA80F